MKKPTRKNVGLTLLLWLILPAPDMASVFTAAGKISFLPFIAPISLAYGTFSLLYQPSRRLLWGYFPGGGLNLSFILETLAIGLGYLVVAYIIAYQLEEPLAEYFSR